MAATFDISPRAAREMARRDEQDQRRYAGIVRDMLAARDITAETRPKYAARLAELAAAPAEVATLNKAAVMALHETLRGLPVIR